MTIREIIGVIESHTAVDINEYDDETGKVTLVYPDASDPWGDIPEKLLDKEVTFLIPGDGIIAIEYQKEV